MKFESHPDYKKFWAFLGWLSGRSDGASGRTAAHRTTKENIDKLKRGVKMMKQLATSYGKEFIIPDSARELLGENFSSKITWIDFKIEGVEKAGLWLGENHKSHDGFSIFNLEWFNEVIKGKEKKDARAIIKFYIDNDCESIG